ncbi:MAG: response regulator [Gemmatimonadetes bacterium]|nr:response regulator [Gemmatimonadota bacterium]
MLRRMIGNDVLLQLELGEGLPPVCADVGQLTQVFMNLAVNARDAMPLGGTLGIETSRLTLPPDDAKRLEVQAGDAVRIVVWDTGAGMDAVTMHRIFEPFFTTKEVGKGSGLGLATVYGIIKQSGGAIVVESQPGEGARFAITIPAADAKVDWPQPPAAVGSSTGAESILLIEDDHDVRNVTARALRASGFTVIECPSGEDAIARALDPTLHVDVLVSDVALPGMSGPAAVQRILQMRPSLPVLFVSGYPRNELDRHGLTGSDVHFLEKPVSLSELTDAVRRLADHGSH